MSPELFSISNSIVKLNFKLFSYYSITVSRAPSVPRASSGVLDPAVQRQANRSNTPRSLCSLSLARLHSQASGLPGWLAANRKYGMGK